jgi:hypothetical protein
MQKAIERAVAIAGLAHHPVPAVQLGAHCANEPYCWQAFRALAGLLLEENRHLVLEPLGI